MPCPDCGHKHHQRTCVAYRRSRRYCHFQYQCMCGTGVTVSDDGTALVAKYVAGKSDSLLPERPMRFWLLGDYLFELVGGFGGLR